MLNRLNLINKKQAGATAWTNFWVEQGIFLELWDLRKKNVEGNSTGLIIGDVLSISGSAGSENYQCPDASAYKTADTDLLWFNELQARRDVATDELRGYDFPRTIVRYLSEDPFSLEAIGILNGGINVSGLIDELLVRLYNDFKLNPWWSGEWIDAGEIKENRPFEQTLWIP